MFETALHSFSDFKALCMSMVRCIWSDVSHKYIRGVVALILAVLCGWQWGTEAGILWGIFLVFLVYEWENRIVGSIALLFLVSCPVLLALEKDGLAEQMAVRAFFFLVMTVVLQLTEYKRHPENFEESENEKV